MRRLIFWPYFLSLFLLTAANNREAVSLNCDLDQDYEKNELTTEHETDLFSSLPLSSCGFAVMDSVEPFWVLPKSSWHRMSLPTALKDAIKLLLSDKHSLTRSLMEESPSLNHPWNSTVSFGSENILWDLLVIRKEAGCSDLYDSILNNMKSVRTRVVPVTKACND